jgi:hypothetical protein
MWRIATRRHARKVAGAAIVTLTARQIFLLDSAGFCPTTRGNGR